MVVERGFGVMRALAIGAAIDFVLLDAEGEADLHDLAAIGEGDDADAVVGVVRPRFEKGFEVWIGCHRLLTLTLPANAGLGNCGRRFGGRCWLAGIATTIRGLPKKGSSPVFHLRQRLLHVLQWQAID